MPLFELKINQSVRKVEVDGDTPLLWVLRDHLDMLGTKYGCGIGICGSCTILVNGDPVRSCALPVSQIGENEVLTIEGLSEEGDHPVQIAWKEIDVAQCGYCQAGQIMSAVALLDRNPNPGKEDIREAMHGNICRCASYNRIEKAVAKAAKFS